MKPDILIPKYISSFELEEARLGQAMQALKLTAPKTAEILENSGLLRKALVKIKVESINVEYAIKNTDVEMTSEVADAISSLLYKLQKKN